MNPIEPRYRIDSGQTIGGRIGSVPSMQANRGLCASMKANCGSVTEKLMLCHIGSVPSMQADCGSVPSMKANRGSVPCREWCVCKTGALCHTWSYMKALCHTWSCMEALCPAAGSWMEALCPAGNGAFAKTSCLLTQMKALCLHEG